MEEKTKISCWDNMEHKAPHHTPTMFSIGTKLDPYDRIMIEAEIELIDTGKKFAEVLGNSVAEGKYRHLAEIYAHEYDNHYKDLSTILHLEGVIVEMYSDIFSFEKLKGESEKSKYQKERLLILRNGFETLKKYFTKYDQLKVIHKHSVLERQALARENEELRTRLKNIELAENFNGREEQ